MVMKKLVEADIFTFTPADLAQLTAVPRSLSVARTILSPSSSSYYKEEKCQHDNKHIQYSHKWQKKFK